MFSSYNAQYFDGKLDAMPVEYDNLPPTIVAYYAKPLYAEGQYISLDVHLESNLKGTHDALLHEMVHAWVQLMYPKLNEDHGPHWKAEMRLLAYKGALDDMLWTDNEQ